jgi:hypothetical protein
MEELIIDRAINEFTDLKDVINLLKAIKQQDKNKYSEEDMKLAYIQGCKNPSLHKTHEEKANEWFKQYKNK